MPRPAGSRPLTENGCVAVDAGRCNTAAMAWTTERSQPLLYLLVWGETDQKNIVFTFRRLLPPRLLARPPGCSFQKREIGRLRFDFIRCSLFTAKNAGKNSLMVFLMRDY